MLPPLQSTLGARIAALRKQLGRSRGKRLTQREFAEMLGVSRESVIGWEGDSWEPSDQNVEKLAAFFETTPEFLLFGTRPPQTRGATPDVNATAEETASEPIRPYGIVGKRIERRRHQLKLEGNAPLTQQDLADRIGAPVRTVESWESGYRYPSGSFLRGLLRELKITPAELFEGVSVPPGVLDATPLEPEDASIAHEPASVRSLRESPSQWTRVPITFRHGDLAVFDQWRSRGPGSTPDMERSPFIRALVDGLTESGISLDDVGSPGELHRLVTRGLRLAIAERDG